MTLADDDFSDQILLIPEVDEDDVAQEAKLLEFRKPGVKANKALIRKRLENRSRRVVLFYDLSAQRSVSTEFFEDHLPEAPEHVISRLLSWCQDQPPHLQALLFDFLENPEFEKIDGILSQIAMVTHSRVPAEPTPARASLAQLIFRSISTNKDEPTSIEDLYDIARTQHISARPEAAVRQTIRTYLQKRVIYQSPSGEKSYYRKS